LADVLNGAWLARLRTTSVTGVDRIAETGLSLCRMSIGKVT